MAITAQLSYQRRDPLLLVTIVVALAALGVGLAALFVGSAGVTSPPATQRPPAVARDTLPMVLGQSQAQAEAALRSAGFDVRVVVAQSSVNTAGTIIVQRPAAGSSISRGSVVSLTVSRGPGIAASSP